MANYHFFSSVVVIAAVLAGVELFRHQVLLEALVGAVLGIFTACTETKLNKTRRANGEAAVVAAKVNQSSRG